MLVPLHSRDLLTSADQGCFPCSPQAIFVVLCPLCTRQAPDLRPYRAADISLITSNDPSTETVYADLRTSILVPVQSVTELVLFRLSYAQPETKNVVLQHCWAIIMTAHSYLNLLLEAIAIAGRRPDVGFTRVSNFMYWYVSSSSLPPPFSLTPSDNTRGFIFHSELLCLLSACHCVVTGASGLEWREALLATSEAHLDRSRVLVAKHARLLLVCLSLFILIVFSRP